MTTYVINRTNTDVFCPEHIPGILLFLVLRKPSSSSPSQLPPSWVSETITNSQKLFNQIDLCAQRVQSICYYYNINILYYFNISSTQFISDVRKIMVTLIEYSLRKMSILPNARNIFDVVRRKLVCENFFVNSAMFQQYQSTGASERRIRFAVNASLQVYYFILIK